MAKSRKPEPEPAWKPLPADLPTLTDPVKINDWAIKAKPRAAIIYHHGYSPTETLSKSGQNVGRIPPAHAAWRLHQMGLVELVQRRASPGFEYVAIRREK